MCVCDVLLKFPSFTFVSLKVKSVTEFHAPQKQIGECPHNGIIPNH